MTDQDPPRSHSTASWIPPRTMVVLVLLVNMVVGILAGIAVDRLFLQPRRRPQEGAWFGGPGGDRGNFGRLRFGDRPDGMQAMDRLSRELELTPEQRQQVEALMAKRTERFRALREEYEPRMRQLVDEGQQELEAVLTPAQRKRFVALRERWLYPRPGPRPDSGPLGEDRPPGPPPGAR